MKNPIVQSNEWYDNLSEPKRTLFFLVFVMGTLILTQYLTYGQDLWYAFPIWASVIASWRISYVFIQWRKEYKSLNK